MHVKKYRAATVKEAFALAQAELGEDVFLLHQRTVQGEPGRDGGTIVEITAATDAEVAQVPVQEPKIRPFFQSPYTRVSSQASQAPILTPTEPARRSAVAPATQSRRRPASSPPTDYDALWHEIRYIRSLLQRQPKGNNPLSDPLYWWRVALAETMLPVALVDTLLLGLEEMLTPPALQRTDMVAAALSQRLATELAPPLGPLPVGKPGNPLVFVLVGPTGVGKTTTLAKLAARYSVGKRLPVALVTADTFRIGAVGQLRTYSDLMRAPLEVAYTPQELADHVARHQDKAVIFVDTPGRSPADVQQLDVLRSFVGVLENPHLQIALAAGTQLADARRIVEQFSMVPPQGILLTKLDEATLLGSVYALLSESGLSLSYLTTGQRVPEDIEIAGSEKIVDRLLQTACDFVDAERGTQPLPMTSSAPQPAYTQPPA